MTNTSKLFTALFSILFLESLAIGFVYNTFLAAIVIGLPTTLIVLWLIKTAPEATLTKHTAAIGAMIYAALHIHQLKFFYIPYYQHIQLYIRSCSLMGLIILSSASFSSGKFYLYLMDSRLRGNDRINEWQSV